MSDTRSRIIELLLTTSRQGINNLIVYMDNCGFFTSPCSSQYHLSVTGGLAEHSLNVCNTMLSLQMAGIERNRNSDIIVSLLHDLGKMGQHGKPNYVENIISDRKGGYVQSDKKPYETNKDLLYIPHEVRSIAIASRFIELTEDEEFAILHHNGMYSDLKYAYSGKETPLSMLLHFADMWCSRVIEKQG